MSLFKKVDAVKPDLANGGPKADTDLDNSFFYMSEIQIVSFDENRRMVEVEILPEGKWKKPSGEGWFEVTKEKIREFVQNFKSGITGKELPLDFNHIPDSKRTPGWIVDLISRVKDNAKQSMYALMQITDPEAWERIKQRSLKYISPQIVFGWVEPKSNHKFDVIKSAALTNYPYIKNMEPMKILNFEEIKKREEGEDTVKYAEFMAKLDEIFAMELEEVEEEKKLGELFESNGLKLQDEGETEEEKKAREKKEEEDRKLAEARPYYKASSRPYYKATARPYYKGYGAAANAQDKIKNLAGGTPPLSCEDKEKAELKNRVQNLEEQIEAEKVDKIITTFKRAGKLAPALAPLVKALILGGRSQVLNFEEKEAKLSDLIVRYFEEVPKLVNFEEIAAQEIEKDSVKSLDRMSQEEVNAEADKLAKEEGIGFVEALDKVTEKHFKAPK